MNKILLISISLLVLIVAVASVSAADVNSTVDDDCADVVDQDCGINEISSDVSEIQDVDVNDTVAVCPEKVDNVVEVQSDLNSIGAQKVLGSTGDKNLFSRENPNHYVVTKAKLDSLKGEIDKYTQIYKKHRGAPLNGGNHGPFYDIDDFILEVYSTHSYVDTVIIVSQTEKKSKILLL